MSRSNMALNFALRKVLVAVGAVLPICDVRGITLTLLQRATPTTALRTNKPSDKMYDHVERVGAEGRAVGRGDGD